jgi:hypothetical protein
MEFYSENAPATPHHSKWKANGPKQVTFGERSKTPFPQKTFGNNTPFPSKAGSAKQSMQPRRALADISNNNASQGLPVAPKTATKTAVKRASTTRAVRFEDDVETCTRVSKYQGTPYIPEVERAVKLMSGAWARDQDFVLEDPPEYKISFDVNESPECPMSAHAQAFEIEYDLLI